MYHKKNLNEAFTELLKGERGDRGEQGFIGSNGDIGLRGIDGAIGLQGLDLKLFTPKNQKQLAG